MTAYVFCVLCLTGNCFKVQPSLSVSPKIRKSLFELSLEANDLTKMSENDTAD